MDLRTRYYLLHLLSFHLDRDIEELCDDAPLRSVADPSSLLEVIGAIEAQMGVSLGGEFEGKYLGEMPHTKRGPSPFLSEIPSDLTVGDFLLDLEKYL